MSKDSAKPRNIDVSDPRERYLNRELSWLAFNARVLSEATNPMNPLLERLKFLSISASNLDEFYMVRVAGLKDQVRHNVEKLSDDGLSAEEQLGKIHDVASEIMQDQQKIWRAIRKELKGEGVFVVKSESISDEERAWLHNYFVENLLTILTPIAVDPAHPFPFLPNQGLAYVFKLDMGKAGRDQIAILPLPNKLQRFIRLPGKEIRFVRLEQVVEMNLDVLFPGAELKDSTLFRILRDSDLEIEEEAEDLIQHFERAVKMRRRGRIIRIKALAPVSEELMQFVTSQMQVHTKDVVEVQGILGLSSLSELYDACALPKLKYTPYEVRFPERISDYGGDCFAAIRAKDIVVHHPFESFDVVVGFLEQAADDPDVVSIKQTLYRTSKDSPIVKALIEAAENGKSVTALVELKARFDEEANIKWARDLERAGAQVVYGFVNLKTHAKMSLVVRKESQGLRSYVHLGTGNYHPTTAKVYTDLSFFTCDADICNDAAYLFNFLTGYSPPRSLKKLIAAPRNMRDTLMQLIENEITNANAGKPAAIWAKMNALVDTKIIDALYKASEAGVQIDLVVRGICCLRPGVPGLSSNIRVKSIVGRFLEHARIFCFGAGHALPSPEAKVFISSADWMPRNFDWRVEAMTPVENPTVHEQVMGQIMMANMRDEYNSWTLAQDGSYAHVPVGEKAFSAHEYFMKNPSLSGRGKALKKAKLVVDKGKKK